MLGTIKKAADECNISGNHIWLLDYHNQNIPTGFRSFRALFSSGEEDWVRFDDRSISENTTAAYLFSSGTTGLPKAAVLSHYNLVAQHEACKYLDDPFIGQGHRPTTLVTSSSILFVSANDTFPQAKETTNLRHSR